MIIRTRKEGSIFYLAVMTLTLALGLSCKDRQTSSAAKNLELKDGDNTSIFYPMGATLATPDTICWVNNCQDAGKNKPQTCTYKGELVVEKVDSALKENPQFKKFVQLASADGTSSTTRERINQLDPTIYETIKSQFVQKGTDSRCGARSINRAGTQVSYTPTPQRHLETNLNPNLGDGSGTAAQMQLSGLPQVDLNNLYRNNLYFYNKSNRTVKLGIQVFVKFSDGTWDWSSRLNYQFGPNVKASLNDDAGAVLSAAAYSFVVTDANNQQELWRRGGTFTEYKDSMTIQYDGDNTGTPSQAPGGTSCIANGRSYSSGQSFASGCNQCICTNGFLACEPQANCGNRDSFQGMCIYESSQDCSGCSDPNACARSNETRYPYGCYRYGQRGSNSQKCWDGTFR